MKRLFQWMIAAILICGTTMFTSCTNEDNPADPAANLSEKILGKWIVADLKGKPALTNEKKVTTFISPTKAIESSSKVDFTEKENKWNVYREDNVVIVGNKITLTGHPTEQNTTLINEYNVSSITNTELIGTWKHITIVDGVETVNTQYDIRLVKQTADYSEAVLGTWEGKVTSSEGSEYDDGETHRWEYKADGTYVYYSQNEEGEWVPSGDEISEYFVDGTLLCTRWVDNEQENREWWEISIDGDKMNWTALRQKEDGSTFTATFEMTKVVE